MPGGERERARLAGVLGEGEVSTPDFPDVETLELCRRRWSSFSVSSLLLLQSYSPGGVGNYVLHLIRVVRVPNPDMGVNLDPTDKVFFFADYGSPGGPN